MEGLFWIQFANGAVKKHWHWGHQHGPGGAIGQLMADAASPPSTSQQQRKDVFHWRRPTAL